jgi:outer membrane protein W
MKKSIIVILMVTSYSLFAQKPQPHNMSMEVSLNLGGYQTINLHPDNGGLKFRYFLTQKFAAQLLGTINYNEYNRVIMDNNSDETGESNSSNMDYAVGTGIEYHIGNSEKISPYLFFNTTYGQTTFKQEWLNTSSGYSYRKDFNRERTWGSNNYRFRLGVGGEYYFLQRLFIGADAGVMTIITKRHNEVTRFWGDATVNEKPRDIPGKTDTGIRMITSGGLRLGVIF